MNLDDFKDPWQQQQRELDHSVDHVVKAVRSRMSWFDQVIWFRDLRESAAAVLVFAWFGYDFFRYSEWLPKFGTILGMLACTMIVVILNWARLTGRVARAGLPLQDFCAAELARVDRQIWLLGKVNWWYTGPLFLAVLIVIYGSAPPPVAVFSLIFCLIVFLLIGWFVYWLNQRAVRLELTPLRHELASAMESTHEDTVLQERTMVASVEPKQSIGKAFVLVAILCVIGLTGLLAVGGGGAFYWAFLRTPTLQIAADASEATRLRKIDQWLAELHRSGQFNGGVLIARDGEPLLIKTYGYADAAGTRRLTDQTPFRLAAVSKQFTAAGILRLVEEGQIELDQPVGDYLSDFPFAGVTVRHLLNQTSGISDVYMELAEQHRKELGDSLRIADVVGLISYHPPVVKSPGDEFLNSNTNYVLLAGVIESVSGKSYEDFMREEIFEPLGMHHTRVWNRVSAKQDFPERAEDFQAFAGSREPLPMSWIDGVAGDGAVFSSLSDFLIWDKFWNENPLVSDRLLAEAFVRPKLNDGSLGDYGFGWVIADRSGSNGWHNGSNVWHNGRWLGAGTYIMRDARSKLCLVVLDNSLNLRVDKIASSIESQALKLRGSDSEPPKLSPFTDVQFESGQVIVTYDGQTCQWLELDGIKVEDIVTSSKKQFGWKWQKRISEDLVEVLWGMNHQPGSTVKLRLVDLKTKQDFVENAPMTEENRRAIYAKRR